MREYLFRGKRVDNGEWVEGFYVCNRYSIGFAQEPAIYENHYIYAKRIDGEKWFKTIQVEVIPETIGQFTGLTDNNGNKIFEGDISQMNKKLQKTLELEKEKIVNNGGAKVGFVDCYNKTIHNDGICGTITTGVSFRNTTFLIEYNEEDITGELK